MSQQPEITYQQRQALQFLADNKWQDGQSISNAIHTVVTGAHRTANSLVRRGLAEKDHHFYSLKVLYRITAAGRAVLGDAR